MKKFFSLLLTLAVLAISCFAVAEAPEGYPEVVEGIDFGGETIYIYDYWTANADRVADPTDEQQAQYDYRDWLEATYNCKIVQIQKGGWESNVQELTNFVTAPDGTLCLYILPVDFVGTPMANNLFADWAHNPYVDLTDEKWNSGVTEFMTKGDKVYGVFAGAAEPRQCLYFNKTILSHAGIEADEIYDLQAEGKWTWDAFEEMLKKIQEDVDNDGIVDVYGMTGNNSDFYVMSVFTNGGSFFAFNDAGELEVTVNSDAAMEALNWSKRIWATYGYAAPEGANWDYFIEAFRQGFQGFCAHQTYGGFNDNAEFSGTDFEWGCVAYPIGPRGDKYIHLASANITVVPAVYDEDTTAKLQFIYDMWSNATPGYDDEDAWIGNKYNYTDDRAVDETYAMLREGDHTMFNAALYLGSINDILGRPLLWNISWQEPAEAIEAAMESWQALCDTFNGK